jgi:hypothetical protein
MTNILRVLSVGSTDPCNTIRDALLQRGHCHLSVSPSSRELSAIPTQECFAIAILHHSASPRELRISGEYIRRRWPLTKILLICAKDDVLNKTLYDAWMAPGPTQRELLAAIERLAAVHERNSLAALSYQEM